VTSHPCSWMGAHFNSQRPPPGSRWPPRQQLTLFAENWGQTGLHQSATENASSTPPRMPHQHQPSTTSVTSEHDDSPLIHLPNLSRHFSAPLPMDPPLTPAKPFNRISAPSALKGLNFGRVLGYEEHDLESGTHKGVAFSKEVEDELQRRQERDARLKRNIRRFRFVVRCMQLGCRYDPSGSLS
jgi:hypothetical protein